MLTTNTQKKIGLVVEGGGMKCAYNAGILMPFWTKGLRLIIVSAYPVDLAIWLPIWRGKEAGIFAFLQSTFIHRITLG